MLAGRLRRCFFRHPGCLKSHHLARVADLTNDAVTIFIRQLRIFSDEVRALRVGILFAISYRVALDSVECTATTVRISE